VGKDCLQDKDGEKGTSLMVMKSQGGKKGDLNKNFQMKKGIKNLNFEKIKDEVFIICQKEVIKRKKCLDY